MQVINTLVDNSFAYTQEKENLARRRNEIGELMEIVAYCQDESVREALVYKEELWETVVQEGVTFADWLWGGAGDGSEEDRRRLQEALSKKGMISLEKEQSADEGQKGTLINVALGEYPSCVFTLQQYVQRRRDILSSIRNVAEYEAFMQSCFIDSCFADNILSGMKHIDHFPERTKEITKALGILNDKAVELYQRYSNHLEEAMRILSALLKRECTPDPEHADDLIFTFTYHEQLEGRTKARTKAVECSPHLKLIHPGSNLRIYFYWHDAVIGAGEKVLVGRIGRHPY